MKRLLTLILIIAWAFNANGQVVRDSTYLADSVQRAEIIRLALSCHGCLIGIEGTDALGNKDTLYFGSDTSTSVGIDNQFGELDVTGRPLKPMDMRFFQRSEVCIANLSIGDSTAFLNPTFLRYRQNLELKKDYRKQWSFPTLVDNYSASSSKYLFRVFTNNYPISFRLIQRTVGGNQFRDFLNLRISSFRNCQFAGQRKLLTTVSLSDTANYSSQNDYYVIGANIGIINSTKKRIRMNLGVYPIPATNIIQITGLRSATNVSITSVTGKETIFKNMIVRPENPEVNIEGLESGIYLLNYSTTSGNQTVKFIKQ
jgi:hypothetical protein